MAKLIRHLEELKRVYRGARLAVEAAAEHIETARMRRIAFLAEGLSSKTSKRLKQLSEEADNHAEGLKTALEQLEDLASRAFRDSQSGRSDSLP
jgi:hypothetical protein